MADFDANALFNDLPTEEEQKAFEKASALFADLPEEPVEDKSVAFGGLGRGFNALQQTGTVLAQLAGWGTEEENAAALIRDRIQSETLYPTSPSYKAAAAQMKEAGEREGWLDMIGGLTWTAITNPGYMLSVATESVPQSLLSTVAGLPGAAARSPALMSAGGGLGSFVSEYTSSILDTLEQRKVDMTDQTALAKALADPELMAAAKDRAFKRGLPIAIFDAISMGVGGKVAGLLGARKLLGEGAEAATQSALGGLGEYGAQVATGESDPSAIFMEAAVEPVTSIPDIVISRLYRDAKPPAGEPPPPAPAGDIIPDVEPLATEGAPPAGEVPPAGTGAPPPPPPTGGAPVPDLAAVTAADEIMRRTVRPASPRLTEEDRKSPIPNDTIDDGKALVEAATGQESTYTTTTEINGKRTVVTGKVSDLVAQDRAETNALIARITAGVTPAVIAPETALGAPPARETAVPATEAPDEAQAAVAAASAPGPIEDVSDDAHPRSEDTETFEEFVAKSNAHIAAREAKAEEMAAKGGSTRLEHKTREGQRALVGPDMAEPGKFRITRFDKDGPFGHTTFNTLKEAANEALRDGYVETDQPTAQPAPQAALKDKIEANRGAVAPAKKPSIATRPVKDDVAITPTGRDVPVTYAVVEAADLVASQRDEGGANPAYPQELQPRDRSRGASDQQVNKIAQNLDPRLLDQNPNVSDGAPIISADGVVESGNGRVLGIRRAYNQGLQTAEGYRQYLAEQGYPVEGMQQPVLVRVRQGELAPDDRAAFTREANERTTLAMSEPEQAMADAAAMSDDTVALYRGGDIDEAGNREFVRSFMGKVVNPNERQATAKGELSQQAIRRIRSALLARAYGAADLVSALVESTDNNIKSIGGALMDIAGLWSQMRAEAKGGLISAEVDITAAVLEAVRLVQRARTEGRPLAEYVSQMDVFSGSTISPAAEAVLRLMFRNDRSWTMPAGREKLADALSFYAGEARKTSAGVDLLGEKAATPEQILATAKRRQYGDEEAQGKLTPRAGTPSPDVRARSEGRAVEAKPGPQAEARPSAAREEPAKQKALKKKVSAKRAEAAAVVARFPAEFAHKGSVGNFAFGYMAKPGERNVWQVRDKRTGKAILSVGRLANHNAASNAAQRLNEEEKTLARTQATVSTVSTPEVELSPQEAMREQIRKEGEARAAKKGGLKALFRRTRQTPAAIAFRKADRSLPIKEPNLRPSKGDRNKRDKLTEDLWNTKGVREAARWAFSIPYTWRQPGYGTPEWIAKRLYTIKGKMVNQAKAIAHLYEVAKTLAIDEINASRREINEDPENAGKPKLPYLEQYKVKNERKLFIVVGPPGAGKSSIANPIAAKFSAAISDVDEAKKLIPEYYQTHPETGKVVAGIGANAVHGESWAMLQIHPYKRLKAEGANLVIPTVGDTYKKIEEIRREFEDAGYTVSLVQMKPTPATALHRMVQRFFKTGRLIPPGYFMGALYQPPLVYRYAERKGVYDGYYIVESDATRTRVVEASGKAQGLVRGEEFTRWGDIIPGRGHYQSGGTEYRTGGEGRRDNRQPESGVGSKQGQVAGKRTDGGGSSGLLRRTSQRETVETQELQGATVRYSITPAFEAKAGAWLKDFRKVLDRFGLTGVDLRIWDQIRVAAESGLEFSAFGQYTPSIDGIAGVINMAMRTRGEMGTWDAAANPLDTAHHEIGHALFDNLTDTEKAIILRKAHKEWITPEIKEVYAGSSRRIIAEEAFVAAFIRWLDGEKMDGMINRIFKKVLTFLKALYVSLTDHEIRNADDIFRQMASGKIGKRSAVNAVGQAQPNVLAALFDRGPGATEADINFFKDAFRSVLDAADAALGPHVQNVITKFTGRHPDGTKVEDRGKMDALPLERIARGEDPTGAAALKAAYAPVREALRKKYGDTVTLYRSQREVKETVTTAGIPKDNARALLSWTFNKNLAREYVPQHKEGVAQGKVIFEAKVPLDQILWATDRADEAEAILRNLPGDKTYVDNKGEIKGGEVIERLTPEQVDALRAARAALFSLPPKPSVDIVDMFEGKREQLVIPGAERISSASLAQRKADAPMRPTRNQRDVDELPLFSDGKKQLALFNKPSSQTDPRFHLAAAPHSAQQAQQVMQGFIARGQLIDRAFRVPLSLLGGTKNGVWHWGKRLDEKMGPRGPQRREAASIGGIIGAGIGTFVGGPGLGTVAGAAVGGTVGNFILGGPAWPTNGAFGFFRSFAENAKRGLITNYGLDPEYVQTFRDSQLYTDMKVREGAGHLKVLENAGVSKPEAEVLQQILSGEPVNDAAMIRLAAPIRQAIDDMGAEAVALGQLSAESFERNRGAYLHRVYQKNEVDQSTLAGWVSNQMSSRRKKIIGDHLKGRGMFWEVPISRLLGMSEAAQAVRAADKNIGALEAHVDEWKDARNGLESEVRALGTEMARQLGRRMDVADRATIKKMMGEPRTTKPTQFQKGQVREQAVALNRLRDALETRMDKLDVLDGKIAANEQRIDQLSDHLMAQSEGLAIDKGRKFQVFDRIVDEKVRQRVYIPADEKVPPRFTTPEWTDRGTWEAREVGKNKVTLWRDYTKEERTKMGEITDARYTIAKTFMLAAKDLGTGKFYKDISVRPEWTQTKEPAQGTWKDGGEYGVMNGRYWEDPDIQWVKVPDTEIAKTGGKKKWGALAGKFIRAEIWRDLNELHFANNPGVWRNIYRQWKANHTYRHPVVHMNNVASNLTFMDLADVRAQDLVAGIKAFFGSTKDYEEARDNGAFGADTVTQELRDTVLKPILDEITQQTTGGVKNPLLNWVGIPFLGKARLAGVFADKLWSWAKTADDGMMRAYRAEDEVFRMALYMRRRSLGDSPKMAAREARDQFLNYDIRAPWVVALRNTLLPFISYTYRAVPVIAHAIQLRPWKIFKYAAIGYAVNALSYMLDDWGDDEEEEKKRKDGETRERAALRDEEQGYTWIGVPRMVRMPWRDKDGMPVFLDVRRWIPAGDVFDTTQGSSALPMPGPLNFGGPLQLAFEFNLNKKAFDGEEITDDLTMTNPEKVGAVVDWAWKAWAPPAFWNPWSHYWTRISNAVRGAQETPGHKYSLPQSLLSSIGVKVKAVDVENGIMWHFYDFKKMQDALKQELRAAARQLSMGRMTQDDFNAKAAKTYEKFGTLEKNIIEYEKTTRMEPAR